MHESARFNTPVTKINHPSPTGLLYHYTTLDGLIGILDSDHIYATHIKYMNDSKEFIDVLDHMDNFVKEFNPSLQANLLPFFDSVKNLFNGIFSGYIVSFTDDDQARLFSREISSGDRLSQWRAYSNNGKGFSLGFDHNKMIGFDNVDTVQNCYALLSYCAYTAAQKRDLFKGSAKMFSNCNENEIEKLLLATSSAFDRTLIELNNLKENKIEYPEHLTSIVAYRLNLIVTYFCVASFCKHHAYFEEKEWRIVLIPLPNNEFGPGFENKAPIPIKFRKGVTGITPYIEVPLGLRSINSPLRRIVVGPTPHMDQAIIALIMLLEDKGIKIKSKQNPNGVEIVPSLIPYRN